MIGGILIIGSLLWDPNRENWRQTRLRIEEKVSVQVPIRYGKISSTRGNTHTMVLSAERSTNLGTGFVVPFARLINNTDQIHEEVVELLSAEKNRRHRSGNYTTTFCIASLAINPNYEARRNELLAHWIHHLDDLDPKEYRLGVEDPIVDKSGILQINWPKGIDNFDFIVATATKPTPSTYPVPQDIAERMNENKYKDYFLNNRASGITTPDDPEIQEYFR